MARAAWTRGPPGQPVVSYVGCSLKEPRGEPRVVIGIDADEAEYLAGFLDRDECAQRGQQVPPQQAQLPQVQLRQMPIQQMPIQQMPIQQMPIQQMPIQQMPIQQMPVQQVPLRAGPLQSGPLQQVKLSESAPEGTGEYPSSALLGAPVPFGRGRQSADQARDLAGWTSGELPGQVNEQLASWPPSSDQPPASA
ncbi:MAG: hypothetical protein ACRDOC_17360 [Streptosporangiaceae bacterium]